MGKTVSLLGVLVFVFAITVGAAFAGGESAPAFKKGDAIYVCGCGADCACGTMARKEGKCACDKDMVKAEVTRVEGGMVYYKVAGEEMSAPAKGKYVCACGEGCDCGTVSQKPGNCACGKPLMKVE